MLSSRTLVWACVGVALSRGAELVEAATTIVVDASPAHGDGPFSGFGVSLAWAGNVFGGRADLADALWTTKDSVTLNEGVVVPGLGLQRARYNVGGCARPSDPPVDVPGRGAATMARSPNMPIWKAIETFWLWPNSTDPSSAGWDWSRDASQRAALAAAVERGAVGELFSNSPPWWALKNLNPSGSDDGTSDNLAPAFYGAHATYMATVAAHFASAFNVTFSSVEAFNEPSGTWWKATGTQEGCHFEPSTQGVVLPLLRSALDTAGLASTPVAASDESLVDQAVTTWLALPPAARAAFDIFDVHGYQGAGGDRARLYDLAVRQGGKQLQNSEHGEGDGTGASLAAQAALDFNVMHVRAWYYWQPVDEAEGWGPLLADMGNARIKSASTKWYVLAGMARHIRAGMNVLNTTSAVAIAAAGPAGAVVWVTNADAGAPLPITVDLSSFSSACRDLRVTRWSTEFSGKGDLYTRYDDTTMTGARFQATLKPASAVTYSIDGCQ